MGSEMVYLALAALCLIRALNPATAMVGALFFLGAFFLKVYVAP